MDLGVRFRSLGPKARTRSGSGSAARSSYPPAPSPGYVRACSILVERTREGVRTLGRREITTCDGITSSSVWTGTAIPIEEWLHLDDYLAPSEGLARGPHKLLISPYDPERHVWIVDDDMHEINKFTNDGQLVMTLGERGVPGRGPNNFNRPTDIAWLPDGNVLRRRWLRGNTGRQVRRRRQLPDGLGATASRSRQPGSVRVLVGPQHRDQSRPPDLRGGSRAQPHAGLRRGWQLPRDVAYRT